MIEEAGSERGRGQERDKTWITVRQEAGPGRAAVQRLFLPGSPPPVPAPAVDLADRPSGPLWK
ncbi:hypothetical protein ACF061_24220 [Streptomyces sp. NPDC015220]|uniref:hypothetical protein n=1 Tax=Streptomyces sp. NPDC015220 TaxID=3364947 RepID=UPI0036F6F87E